MISWPAAVLTVPTGSPPHPCVRPFRRGCLIYWGETGVVGCGEATAHITNETCPAMYVSPLISVNPRAKIHSDRSRHDFEARHRHTHCLSLPVTPGYAVPGRLPPLARSPGSPLNTGRNPSRTPHLQAPASSCVHPWHC